MKNRAPWNLYCCQVYLSSQSGNAVQTRGALRLTSEVRGELALPPGPENGVKNKPFVPAPLCEHMICALMLVLCLDVPQTCTWGHFNQDINAGRLLWSTCYQADGSGFSVTSECSMLSRRSVSPFHKQMSSLIRFTEKLFFPHLGASFWFALNSWSWIT